MSDINSSLPVRTETAGDVIVKIADATTPAQQLKVNVDGSINITDNAGSITVDGTVELGATTLAALESITVQNPGGAGAVNIQDGGNSITIDNTDLTALNGKVANDYGASTGAVRTAAQIGNTTGAANFAAGVTGAQTLRVTANVTRNGTELSYNAGSSDANTVRTSSNITRNGTELSYNLGAADANTLRTASLVTDGTDVLAVNTDGSINVVVQEDVGVETINYSTAAAVAAGATSNHDLVFASASKLYQVLGSASGKLKCEIQIETGSATNVFNTICVRFNSTADPDCDMTLSKYAAIPAGARVRVIRTNKDNQAQDVYTTIIAILG